MAPFSLRWVGDTCRLTTCHELQEKRLDLVPRDICPVIASYGSSSTYHRREHVRMS